MGNAFLHGQGGGSGVKINSATEMNVKLGEAVEKGDLLDMRFTYKKLPNPVVPFADSISEFAYIEYAGILYCLGTANNSSSCFNLYRYDDQNEIFVRIPISSTDARWGGRPGLTVHNNEIYIAALKNGGTSAGIWKYNPNTSAFTYVAHISSATNSSRPFKFFKHGNETLLYVSSNKIYGLDGISRGVLEGGYDNGCEKSIASDGAQIYYSFQQNSSKSFSWIYNNTNLSSAGEPRSLLILAPLARCDVIFSRIDGDHLYLVGDGYERLFVRRSKTTESKTDLIGSGSFTTNSMQIYGGSSSSHAYCGENDDGLMCFESVHAAQFRVPEFDIKTYEYYDRDPLVEWKVLGCAIMGGWHNNEFFYCYNWYDNNTCYKFSPVWVKAASDDAVAVATESGEANQTIKILKF